MIRLRQLALVALSGIALAACSKSAAPAPDAGAPECATRADCPGGMICSAHECTGCASNGQCELRELCDPAKLLCAFKPGWGAQCAANAQCAAGQLCVQGLCVAQKDATLCASGKCLAAGQRCNPTNNVCEQDIGCSADTDCAESELCNQPTHACVARCTAATQGQVCAAGQKCLDSRCTDCADSSDCPGGMVCDRDRLSCVVDGAARCLSDRDCTAGNICNQATGFCTPPPPPCLSNEACAPSQRCDVAAGKCVAKACQPDKYEPNSSVTEAKPLAVGTFADLTLCDGEQDWFSFKLTRGDRLDVFVDADPLFQDVMDTRLLDGAGRVLAQGALALDQTVAADATYYLRLHSTDSFVSYGLRIGLARGVPCDEDRFFPNGDPQSAAPIHTAGEIDKLTLCGKELDWFLLDVPVGKKLKVELHYLPTEGAADLRVYAKDGTTLLGQNAMTAEVETVVVGPSFIEGGQVLVEVASLDERANAEYFLAVVFE